MDKLKAFLAARFGERSSIIQTLGLLGTFAVMFGLVSVDELNSLTGSAAAAIAIVTQLAGILTPDNPAKLPPVVGAALDAHLPPAQAADVRDEIAKAGAVIAGDMISRALRR